MLIFLIIYIAFCRNSYYFKFNRVYIISSLLISIISPIINWNFLNTSNIITFNISAISEIKATAKNFELANFSQNDSNQFSNILLIYIIGFLFSSFLLIYNLLKINNLKKNITYHNGYKMIINEKVESPFSFFNKIFLPGAEYLANEMILQHEISHVKQKHSLDIIFIHIIKCIFWFSPLPYFYLKLCQENHEFLADKNVINRFNRKEYGNLLIQNLLKNNQLTIVNQFNSSQIKKRLLMLSKKNATSFEKIKISFALFLSIFVLGTSIYAQKDSTTLHGKLLDEKNSTIYTIVDQMPKYGNDMQDLIKYLGSHVKYPALSREIGADGMVVLSFIVGKDGILYNIKVARSAYNSENIEKTKARHITTKTKEPLTEIMIKNGFLALDNEAIRVLESMDKWTPGKQNGKEIDVRFTLPVKFKLE